MKTTFTTLLIVAAFALNLHAEVGPLSKSERKFVINSLVETRDNLFDMVKGLSADQLNFKADEESWSIAECIEHIAKSEFGVWQSIDKNLNEAVDESRRSEINFSDEQIITMISSREQKVKTFAVLEPNNQFGSSDSALNEFKKMRDEHIDFVKSTEEDLRNRYNVFPFGLIDTYQTILFMSAHSARHTAQIEEIMNHENFPE